MTWMNIFVLSMMFFVNSCRSPERALICNEVTKYQVVENEVCVVSIKFNACLCADKFDINSWSQISDFKAKPLEYCDGIMGVQKEFALKEIQPKFKALQRLRESSCQTNRNQKSLNSKILSKPTTTLKMTEGEEYYLQSFDSANLDSKDSL
jgi:hypothetical protein